MASNILCNSFIILSINNISSFRSFMPIHRWLNKNYMLIGAGKSSLFQPLFRLIEWSNIGDEILIDDIDISRIAFDHLRSNLSIIPKIFICLYPNQVVISVLVNVNWCLARAVLRKSKILFIDEAIQLM